MLMGDGWEDIQLNLSATLAFRSHVSLVKDILWKPEYGSQVHFIDILTIIRLQDSTLTNRRTIK